MRRKLLHCVREEDDTAESAGPVSGVSAAERVDSVIEWLEANRYLSEERFVEARLHTRASRFGNLRLRAEFRQHGVSVSPEVTQALRQSELQRARAVRERKFAALPESSVERAKQARFLAGRGFSPDVIGKALRAAPPSEDRDEPSAAPD